MTTESSDPGGRTNWLLIILGVAVLVLAGAVVFLLVNREDQSPATTVAPATSTAPTITATTAGTTSSTAPTTTTSTVPPQEEFSFGAAEDTYVDSDDPSEILGDDVELDIRNEGVDGDIRNALMRFDLGSLPDDRPVVQAVLRLTVLDESSVGGVVSHVGGPWTEAETTWDTAPPIGDAITPLLADTEGLTTDVDVTAAVSGPGVVEFYLTTSSVEGMEFASRESDVGAPILIVTLGEAVAGSGEVVLVGAGDIASCASQGDEATAAILDEVVGAAAQAVVFTAGDNAYESGTAQNFADCYEPTWGRHKAITSPTPGSREYRTADAAGYFGYFGAGAGEPGLGYYSYDLGGWHIVALNSNCDQVGGCDSGSAQVTWLQQDLAASEADCTLAYWHHPLFSSGRSQGEPQVESFFESLYAAEAEVVINADDHLYERFGSQDPDGVSDQEDGIRQFIVGTGGRSLDEFGSTAVNSEVRYNEAFGVLVMTLLPDGYEWSFEAVAGSSFTDIGGGTCH